MQPPEARTTTGPDVADPAALEQPRPLVAWMRRLLVVAGVLVFLAGVQLYVFPDRTPEWFAWTIDPPLTALFLGAAYWSALALELSAARSRTWAGARIAVPSVFVFTSLTMVVTLVHLDRFHLGAEHTAGTRSVTWAWIAIYAVVPVLMAVAWLVQRRVPGGVPPRSRALTRWVRAAVALLVVLLAVVGAVALASPETARTWWPWTLTPLTARAIGAWAIGLAVAGAHALVEDDVARVRPAAWAFLCFGVLEAVALVRGNGDVDWSDPVAWVLVAVLCAAVAIGSAVLRTPSGEPVVSHDAGRWHRRSPSAS